MMSLMVFTISAVNAWGIRETSFQFGWFWNALPKRLHPTLRVLYLDLLVYIELFMMDVLHLNHQDVGIWQRLKLRSQISFWNLTQIKEVKCVKALKHSAVWPNYCHSLYHKGPSRQTSENGLSMIWCFHVVSRSFRLCLPIPVSDLSFPSVWVFLSPSCRGPGCRWPKQGCCLASRPASNQTCSS